MPTDQANATAAPFPITIGNETLLCSPLRQVDFGEFLNFVKREYLKTYQANQDLIPAEYRDGVWQAGLHRASMLTLASSETLQLMVTIEGAAYLLWLAIRQRHPEKLLADAAAIVQRDEWVDQVEQALEQVTAGRLARKKTATPPTTNGHPVITPEERDQRKRRRQQALRKR